MTDPEVCREFRASLEARLDRIEQRVTSHDNKLRGTNGQGVFEIIRDHT